MKHEGMGLHGAGKWLPVLAFCCAVLAMASAAPAVIVDFTGGTATRVGGGTFVPNNLGYVQDAVSYVEDGVKVQFNGFQGIIGDYYSIGAGGFVGNDVIHAHWVPGASIVFSKVDGTSFDLTYFDLSSNTEVGGGQCTGNELSYITASNGHSMLLPPSDWGFAIDYYGQAGDGIKRLWLDTNFLGITSFTVTSANAYCFGLDNFYIDQPAPPDPTVPEPITAVMACIALASLAPVVRRRLRL
jgi:hypothetical protein